MDITNVGGTERPTRIALAVGYNHFWAQVYIMENTYGTYFL
jgi:hypothetical protein